MPHKQRKVAAKHHCTVARQADKSLLLLFLPSCWTRAFVSLTAILFCASCWTNLSLDFFSKSWLNFWNLYCKRDFAPQVSIIRIYLKSSWTKRNIEEDKNDDVSVVPRFDLVYSSRRRKRYSDLGIAVARRESKFVHPYICTFLVFAHVIAHIHTFIVRTRVCVCVCVCVC